MIVNQPFARRAARQHSTTSCGGRKQGRSVDEQRLEEGNPDGKCGQNALPSGFLALEAELRAERDPQVVLRAMVKVDGVPDLKPQTDRPPKAFDTRARIKRETGIAIGHAPQRSLKSGS